VAVLVVEQQAVAPRAAALRQVQLPQEVRPRVQQRLVLLREVQPPGLQRVEHQGVPLGNVRVLRKQETGVKTKLLIVVEDVIYINQLRSLS